MNKLIEKYNVGMVTKYHREVCETKRIYEQNVDFYKQLDEELDIITTLLETLHLEIDDIHINGKFVRIYAKSIDDGFEFFDSSKRVQLQKKIGQSVKGINKMFEDNGLIFTTHAFSLETMGISEKYPNTVIFDNIRTP